MQNNFNISIFVMKTGEITMKTYLFLITVFIWIAGIFSESPAMNYRTGSEKRFRKHFSARISAANTTRAISNPSYLSVESEKNKQIRNSETKLDVVVIDPGHGGRDPGAVSGSAREKNIVLDIALKLGNYITESFPGVEVIYTRNNDRFVPLYRRAEIANKNKADLFISIHANSVKRGLVKGTETFVLGQHRSEDNLEIAKKENAVILLEDDYTTTYEGFNPNSSESYIMFELVQDEYLEQSVMFASTIQDQFRERAKRTDRSVKQAGFLVLRHTTMPSVLVETGFLSHPGERNFLMSETGRDYLASAIFRAFRDYKKKIEEKSSFHLVTENKTSSDKKKIDPDITFSVQVAALTQKVDPTPANFKGETTIFEHYAHGYYKYFSGRFESLAKANREVNRLKSKFSGAFVVAFRKDELISVKNAIGKM